MSAGLLPTLWRSIVVTLRVWWRVTRQLFHEFTGALFVVFAAYGAFIVWQEWKHRPARCGSRLRRDLRADDGCFRLHGFSPRTARPMTADKWHPTKRSLQSVSQKKSATPTGLPMEPVIGPADLARLGR